MNDEIKNLPVSIKARILNISVKNNKNFNLILQLYIQERLLYRISRSNYYENFILKGGLFLFSLSGFKGRPTRDVDFLACGISNDIEDIKCVFTQICKLDYPDGVTFDVQSIRTEKIREKAKYEGVRLSVNAYIGKAVQTIRIDICFGEVVVPKPIYMDYPVLLNMEAPKIKVYSIESVVSEKFEAIISLSIINGRLKDFYDIYKLLSNKDFDGRVLQEAMFETFQKRNTILEKNIAAFEESFLKDTERLRQWNLFLNKIGEKDLSFEEVINSLKKFLLPVYSAIIYENEFFKAWSFTEGKWQ